MKTYIEKYARLLVELGVALQKGEYLLLEADAENLELVRAVTKVAMEKGARDVIVFLRDAYADKYRAQYGMYEEIASAASWQKESLTFYLEQGAVSLLLKSPRPELMEGVAASAGKALLTSSNERRNVIRKFWTERGTRWCIACAPNRDWAQYLYPEMEAEEAYRRLWEILMGICQVDTISDPMENWKETLFSCYQYSSFMNRHKFDSIHFYGDNGTDFIIGFHPEAFWVGGSNPAEWSALKNLANIPTNEVSTSPDKYRMDGVVYSTRPLLYGERVIDSFCLTFREGKVVEAKAETGQEFLEQLLEVDEGSRRLGEVAFVECDSPVARTEKTFYTTLLDENASCHMALGNGFSVCIPEMDVLSEDEYEMVHLNRSDQHVDFMFGYEGLNADGYTLTGEKCPIFRKGKFII